MADISRKRLSKKKNLANLNVARRKASADAIKDAAKSDSSLFRYQATYTKNGVKTSHTVDMTSQGENHPTIVAEIMDWMSTARSSITPEGVRTIRSRLNSILKYLDEWNERNVHSPRPVKIHDFTEEVGIDLLLWYRTKRGNDTTKSTAYGSIRHILTSTSKHHGAGLVMPPNPWKVKITAQDTYDDAVVKSWLKASISELRHAKHVIRVANKLADNGDPNVTSWSPEKVAVIFRDQIGLQLMGDKELRAAGLRNWRSYADKFSPPSDEDKLFGWYTSFLPSQRAIAAAFIIVSCRTGWNEQSILDMNINDWCRPYALSNDISKPLYLVYTRKKRAGDKLQETISTDAEHHVYSVLKWVLEATEPVRNQMRQQINDLEEKAVGSRLSQTDVDKLLKLKEGVESFWIILNRQVISKPAMMSKHIMSKVSMDIAERSSEFDEADPFYATKARDSWILWAYESTGFNLLVAQVAAGHSNLKSIINYIHKKKVTAENRQKVWSFQDHLFSEIELGRVDPLILRGRFEDGAMTPEQAKELAEKEFIKTIHGAYCADPYNPDPDVDFDHKPGEVCGTQNCHRCRNAFWFLDSIQDIADEVQALRQRKTETSIDAWETSQLPEKLEFYEKLLMSYDESARIEAMACMSRPLPSVQFQASKHFYESS